jgi:hypothetical protein
MTSDVLEEYDETSLALDFRLDFRGLRLQSEYVYRRVMYDTPIVEDMARMGMRGLIPMVDTGHFNANHIGRDAYGLLAYNLPLERWLGSLHITPYVFVEYSMEDDTFPFQEILWITAGLNIRPSPYVVFKLQYDDVNALHEESDVDGYEGLLVQMAVTY